MTIPLLANCGHWWQKRDFSEISDRIFYGLSAILLSLLSTFCSRAKMQDWRCNESLSALKIYLLLRTARGVDNQELCYSFLSLGIHFHHENQHQIEPAYLHGQNITQRSGHTRGKYADPLERIVYWSAMWLWHVPPLTSFNCGLSYVSESLGN